jgi:desulfoferrodoxin (superoxide reductase-like protein)
MKRKTILLVVFLLSAWAVPAPGLADKSSVTIEAPATAEKGSQVPVKVHVKHKGNSFMHYTNWVEVKVNGETVERWEYSAFKRPEDEVFTKEIVVQVDEPLEIVGEASCNIHGSAGTATAIVKPAPEGSGEQKAP